MALECIKGTTVPIVEVVKSAKETYISLINQGYYRGMCDMLERSIKDRLGIELDGSVTNYIPKFNKKIAFQLFNSGPDSWFYWWSIIITKYRILYFDWLIEEYSKEV